MVLLEMDEKGFRLCQPFEPSTMMVRVRGFGLVRVRKKLWKDRNN